MSTETTTPLWSLGDAGRLTFVVKSAHIYDTEAACTRGALAQAAAG